jgi:hypothetical protein
LKGCITGILENSKQLQAIIKKDWKKLEQLNKKKFKLSISINSRT